MSKYLENKAKNKDAINRSWARMIVRVKKEKELELKMNKEEKQNG